PTPSTTPSTTPTAGNGLPNTGPGDIVGIVAVTTVVGAAAHNIVTRRRAQS
ncbi:hypothetical protein H0X10_03610, partial [Candidatus Saccharibacteria bacterium]|nr:hypothetical protein [Candidatus Saccharibacteria bacterium]